MLMKIGILTLNGFVNYGNRLQNYALKYFLTQFVDSSVETIWHTENNYLPVIWKLSWKVVIKYIINYKNFRTLVKNNYFGCNMIRQYNFKKFSDSYQKINYSYNLSEGLDSQYDYFIVGSDQVWNPYGGATASEFLTFTSKDKRIAYAASIGLSSIPKEKRKKFKNWLEGMNYISVREKNGADIIFELTGKRVPVLVDPTLLLSKEEWSMIAKKPLWYKDERYMLIYFLGTISLAIQSKIDEVAKKYDLKIINLMDIRNLNWYTAGPDEFVYLIKHSCLIYTDSFHGAVFSIIMNRPFIVFDRRQTGFKNMTSRIENLLELFDLQSRRGNIENNYEVPNLMDVDYSNVEGILSVERKRSEEYIKKALNINK